MVLTETYITEDYSQFKTHELQPTNRARVYAELIESLKSTDGNRFNPIWVSEKTMQVLDGHRRLSASNIAGLPVWYILLNVEEESKLMAYINSTSKNWTTSNFINHNAQKDENYEVLEAWLSKQGATVELIKLFIDGLDAQMLKKGVDISHLDYNYLEQVRKASSYISGKFMLPLTMSMRALKLVYKHFDGDLDMLLLVDKMEQSYINGHYNKVGFVNNKDRLTEVLISTYKRKF